MTVTMPKITASTVSKSMGEWILDGILMHCRVANVSGMALIKSVVYLGVISGPFYTDTTHLHIRTHSHTMWNLIEMIWLVPLSYAHLSTCIALHGHYHAMRHDQIRLYVRGKVRNFKSILMLRNFYFFDSFIFFVYLYSSLLFRFFSPILVTCRKDKKKVVCYSSCMLFECAFCRCRCWQSTCWLTYSLLE